MRTKFHFFISILLVLFFSTVQAQVPSALWGNAIGDGRGGLSKINDLVKDEQGNTYVVGTLRRLLDVDPSEETFLLSANNTDDLWMAAYSPQSELIWANKIANSNTENISAIHLDQNNNLLICGFFTNTLDFDPSAGVFELTTFSASNSDAFFASYSTEGELNWVKQIGGSSVDNAQDITTDYEGNIILTGNFSDIADFDPSSGSAELTATGNFNDLYLAKYTGNGNYLWSFNLTGSNFPDNGQALGVLSDNSIVLGAIYQGDLDADPGIGVAPINHANNYDALLACYDSDGNYLWAGNYGLNADDRVNSIAIDNSDNIYVGGYFNQTVDFDFGAGTASATSAGNDDACLISYDASGNLRWFRTWGSTGADEIQGIAINDAGKIAVTGGFNGTVDFDSGPDTDELTAQSTDLFLAIYNQDGTYERAINIGGTGFDFGNAVFMQGDFVTVGGLFANTVDFDPSVQEELRTVGLQTAFFASYSIQNLQLNQLAAMQDRNGDNDAALGMTKDSEGNIYVCGSFEGSAFFAQNSDEFPSSGEIDAFIVKYSPSGTPLMVITFGGIGEDIARSIEVDNNGNIYVVGSFEGSMDVDPGNGEVILTSAGNTDVFLIKYDNAGNLVWANAIGGGAEDMGFDITLNSNQDAFITGHFRADVDFDLGPNELLLSASIRDCFIAGYSGNNGALIWAKQISGPSSEYGSFITSDQSNAIYAGGYFASTIDADPGAATFPLSSNGSNDAFVVKLNNLGDFDWAFSFGASGSDQISSIKINANDEMFLGGYFTNSFDFDPNAGETILTSEGQTDIFLMKFTNQADAVTGIPVLDWAYSFGSTGSDFLFDIDLDDDKVYFSGTMSDTINFDIAENPEGSVGSPFSSQGYYASLNEDASFVEAYQFDGQGQSFFYQIMADQSDLFIAGSISGDLDIQPGPAENILEGIGETDGFIFKLGDGVPCDPSFSELTETACQSLTLNGQTYSQSGQFTQTLLNVAGCDSVITLNLTILEASSASLDVAACQEFTLNGETYSSSGSFTQTLTNAAGCDSVLTLNLTILEASSASLDEAACETFTLNGQSYSNSGSFTQTLTNAAGCDSVLTLNLSISQAPDVSIAENGNVLTANQENATYQWINCTTNEEILGETQQTFEATTAGSFAVIITDGECSETSECVVLSTVQLPDNIEDSSFNLYPNPANSNVIVVLPQDVENASISIYSADGRLCISKTFHGSSNSLLVDTSLLEEGIYRLSVQNNNAVYTKSLIVLR
ncbi:MAG: T9SS type A sorting domain-containing protein [Bacteroidia bacterium]